MTFARQMDISYTHTKPVDGEGYFPFEYNRRILRYNSDNVLIDVIDDNNVTFWTTSRAAAQRLVNAWDANGRSPLTDFRRNQYHYTMVEPSEEYKQASEIVDKWGGCDGAQSELVRAICDALLKAKGK